MQMLVKTEQKILAECEATIKKGLATFMDVGSALMRIRDGRLYREQYGTFEAYCQEKWGMSRMHAHRLMSAAEVTENVTHGLQTKPTSERQVRPLAGLEPEKQKEVWISAVEKAKEENRKVTAKDVEMAKAEIAHVPPNKKPLRPIGPPRDGLQFARIAIMNLEQIKKNDIERKEAFEVVKGWIKNNES